jgi:hypothetical protein
MRTQSSWLVSGLCIGMAACNEGSTPKFTVGGSVSGLLAGATVKLQDNGTDTLTVPANGPFTFAATLFDRATRPASS